MIVKILEEPKYSGDDVDKLETYLQWKSDCWRNVAISLFESTVSGNQKDLNEALAMFSKVRNMFPYVEEHV